MSTHTHWHTVWDEPVEGRVLTVEREDARSFYRVRARQDAHDEGIAYQDGATYVHISPGSVGEMVEGEASSIEALGEVLREMHFPAPAVQRVLQGIGDA
jgi:hypothetical protein